VSRGAIPYRLPRPETRLERRRRKPATIPTLFQRAKVVTCWHKRCSLAFVSNQLHAEESLGMVWTILAILLALWLLGFLSGYTIGGFVHILLALAILIFILNLLRGRSTV
jgi:Family of unknown function (DUF5670)